MYYIDPNCFTDISQCDLTIIVKDFRAEYHRVIWRQPYISRKLFAMGELIQDDINMQIPIVPHHSMC